MIKRIVATVPAISVRAPWTHNKSCNDFPIEISLRSVSVSVSVLFLFHINHVVKVGPVRSPPVDIFSLSSVSIDVPRILTILLTHVPIYIYIYICSPQKCVINSGGRWRWWLWWWWEWWLLWLRTCCVGSAGTVRTSICLAVRKVEQLLYRICHPSTWIR